MRAGTLGLALLVAGLACAPAGSERAHPDVIIVTVDTLRADALGAYGRADARTPHIDALAARGMRFDHATCPVPRTTPALATMLTGLEPHRHGSVRAAVPIATGTTLGEMLRPLGFETAAVSASRVASRKEGLHRGFDFFEGKEDLPHWRAGVLSERALALVDRVSADAPLFLWVHYTEPHWPYRPPAHMQPGPEGDACRDLLARVDAGEVKRLELQYDVGGVAAGALDSCRVLYQAEVAHVDQAIGALFDGLRTRGRWDDAIVVLTADHGENFGEGGSFYQHGANIYDASLRIPLVIAGPGIPAGVERAPFRLEDIPPTLLGMLGVPPDARPPADGADRSARLRGERPVDEDIVALARSGPPEPRERAARTGRFKLVDRRTPGGGLERLLIDLEADPQETRDASAEHPEVAARLAATLDAWIAEVEGTQALPDLDADQRERLRELGYLE